MSSTILNKCLELIISKKAEKFSLLELKFEKELSEYSLVDIYETLKKCDQLFDVYTDSEIFIKVSIKLMHCKSYNSRRGKCTNTECKSLHICKNILKYSMCPNQKCQKCNAFDPENVLKLLNHFNLAYINYELFRKFYNVYNKFSNKIKFFEISSIK
jgi:hypothetical protein